MSTRLQELAARRRALTAESDLLRVELAESVQGLRSAAAFLDFGLAAAQLLGRRPVVLAGLLGVALVALRRRRVLQALSIALTAVSILHRTRRLFPRRPPPES